MTKQKTLSDVLFEDREISNSEMLIEIKSLGLTEEDYLVSLIHCANRLKEYDSKRINPKRIVYKSSGVI